jgi:CDP-diacylglycerol--glycerol-3-phosphate 3-phosphatidyltransferase
MSQPGFALLNTALIFGAAYVGVTTYRRAHPDVSGVRGSAMLGSHARAWYFSTLEPIERLLVRHGVKAIALTYAQVVAALLVALAYAGGFIYTAGVLLLFTGTLDIMDGKVARRTNGDSRRGAFLDSVVDRYAEFFCYLGLMVFFSSGWRVWAVLFAILGGSMVSYTRARAEGLGLQCEIGLLQRPERFVLLGFGSIFSALGVHLWGGSHGLLTFVVVLIAVLSNTTAAQRIIFTSRKLREVNDV